MSDASLRYAAPNHTGRGQAAYLVAGYGTADEQWFTFSERLEVRRDEGGTADEEWYAFSERLEIRRDEGGDAEPAAVLFVADATVSRSHCLLTYQEDGRCFVRDTSRNGTRVDGRRLVPNVDVELVPGQHVTLGQSCDFVVMFEQPAALAMDAGGTLSIPSLRMARMTNSRRKFPLILRIAASSLLFGLLK